MSNLIPFSGRKGRLKFDDSSGNDGGDGSMEARVAKLESDVGHIMRDVSAIKQKLERVADDIGDLKVSLTTQAGRQDTFGLRVEAIEQRFEAKLDALDKKFDAKFDGLDKKFATKSDLHEALNKQQQWMFRTMLALISLGVGVTGAVVAALMKYLPHT
ncbi:hypothetical protein [Aeromonas enteropelogenes]|uniref:hypothetical protein n=1 Tax=Aeromonas enteropelogenes TaxID=29489 RepID=UPI003B9F4A61